MISHLDHLVLTTANLNASGVVIEDGPVMRTGATSRIRSVYVRDPDLHLIEISERVVDA